MAPLSNDQAFTSVSLWGPFLFKPPRREMTVHIWLVSGVTGNPTAVTKHGELVNLVTAVC